MATKPTEAPPLVEDGQVVAALANGLAVIRAFDATDGQPTLSEISRATGLTRSTARRSLLTLKALGYVTLEDNRFALTPKVLELAGPLINANDSWIRIAAPYLEQLRNTIEENVSAVVLDREDIVYVCSYPAKGVMSLNIKIGERKPAFATAMGRILLAHLPEECARDVLNRSDIRQYTENTVTDIEALMNEIRLARDQGYAVIDQELEMGLIAVSVPLHDLRGDLVAAINVCGHSMHSSLDRLIREGLPEATRVAKRVAALIR